MRFHSLSNICAAALCAAIPAPAAGQDSPARAGDQVALRIVRDTVFQQTLPLDPRGMVVLPLVGDVMLGGIAGNAVQDTIRARLARFVSPSAVEATLLRRVRVMGDVTRPGVYYVDRTFTLRDAVAFAGGASESGNPRRVTLERAGVRQELLDLRNEPVGLTHVESGDQLVVERLPWYQRNALALVTTASTILATILITLSR